jgi:hypothetical protein
LIGPTLHPASGRIRVSNKPAAGVRIRLQPLGAPTNTPNPHATTGADGGFVLETSGQPGAPEGRYAVTLTWPPPGGLGLAKSDRFGGRYTDPHHPFIELTIKPGLSEFSTFDVPEKMSSVGALPK